MKVKINSLIIETDEIVFAQQTARGVFLRLKYSESNYLVKGRGGESLWSLLSTISKDLIIEDVSSLSPDEA